MGRISLLGALLAATLLFPAAALAADQTIIVGPQKTLSPPSVTVGPDETVTWQYAANSIDHHIRTFSPQAETWDFGQHFSGTFTHTFTKSGQFNYHCELHPNDMRGTITVTGSPVPAIVDPGSPFSGVAVNFDGSGSSDPDGTVDTFAWDFGDGGTGTGSNPSHTYASAGTFTAKLTVTDNRGNTASTTRPVTVRSTNPVAAFTSPATAAKGAAVNLDGSGSSPGNSSITSFAWDFGDGATGTGATASHTYTTAGAKSVTLTVTVADGRTAVLTKTVTVTNAAPTASLAASSTAPANGANVTLTATAADGDGTIASYAWDLDGNGTFETPGGTTPTITRAFTTAGPVAVKVRVTDNEGATTDAAVTLNVAAPPSQGGGGTTTPTTGGTTPPAGGPTPGLTPPTVGPAVIAVASTKPSTLAPAGQKLRKQRGVRLGVKCAAACKLVITGSVKAGAKKLRLSKLTRSLAAGEVVLLKVRIDSRDLKALRKAKGKAKAALKVVSTAGGQQSVQRIAVSLKV